MNSLTDAQIKAMTKTSLVGNRYAYESICHQEFKRAQKHREAAEEYERVVEAIDAEIRRRDDEYAEYRARARARKVNGV